MEEDDLYDGYNDYNDAFNTDVISFRHIDYKINKVLAFL
jgi:hypothetical protein